MSFAQAPNDPGLALGVKQVATVLNHALINGTGTIAAYTVPNDGNLHTVIVSAELTITVAETGGQVTCQSTANGNNLLQQLFPAGLGGGNSGNQFCMPCDPGSTVTIAQGSALTAGAATLTLTICSI